MVDLSTLANYAEIFGTSAVLLALIFALVQLRHLRRQRRETAAIEFMHSLQTQEFQRAILSIWRLPDGLGAEEVRSRGASVEEFMWTIIWSAENIGVLVYERILDLRTVDRLIGGFMRDSWKKLARFVSDERERIGTDTFAEWFQWLVEQLERHGDPHKRQGAHRLYADWRPT